MNNLQQLEFKLKLAQLKNFDQLDEAFSDHDFTSKFTTFIHGKIGKLWLNGPRSKRFKDWQKSY